MQPSQIKTDGIVDFSGGMDSYTSPSLLRGNQYVYAVNMQLEPGKVGIQTRPGFREVKINFRTRREEELYRNSKNIQGCGYFTDGGITFLLVSCDGFIFQFKEVNKWEYDASLVLTQNNPNLRKTYFSNVPKGVIINDGESAPIFGRANSFERIYKSDNSIGAGHAGIYLQGRFFYISEDRKRIIASTINNPTDISEANLANLAGFYVPDDTFITAIGTQKYIDADADGGSLVFSTLNNIYSIDVRGPISGWGQGNVGRIGGDIYDVSAVSPFSFLNVTGNIYFRSRDLGIASLQYLKYLYNSSDVVEPESFGGHLFFNNDDSRFLSNCYAVKYNNRIYTTIAPTFTAPGVYWNGLIVVYPKQQGGIVYESIVTGIRPWCMVTTKDSVQGENLYIHSYDCDGVNRLYVVDKTINYDITAEGNRVEIESQLLTKSFVFGSDATLKHCNSQNYSISGYKRNVNVNIFSRTVDEGNFFDTFSTTHKALECINRRLFVNEVLSPSSRDNVPFPGYDQSFYFIQDLFRIRGYCSLKRILRQVFAKLPEKTTHIQEKTSSAKLFCPQKIFTYNIR